MAKRDHVGDALQSNRATEAERRSREETAGLIAQVMEHRGAEAIEVEQQAPPWSAAEFEVEDVDGLEATPRTRSQSAKHDLPVGNAVEGLYTTQEIAMFLRVHPKTVERLRASDGLPCLRIGGSVRYQLSAVISWATARQEVR